MTAIVLTHGHNDHINTAVPLPDAVDAPILLHTPTGCCGTWCGPASHRTGRWRPGRRLLAGGHTLVVLPRAGPLPPGAAASMAASGAVFAAEHAVLDEVHDGEILGIIGPNGSGKSTLFNCILGQLQPSQGEVRFEGQDITGMRPCDLNRRGVTEPSSSCRFFRN